MKAVLPEPFSRKVIQVWGVAGAAWLHEFPRLLEDLCLEWGLSDVQPAEDLSYNFVAYARRSGQAVVLKIAVIPSQLDAEARALKAFRSQHAANLLDHDLERGALLLGRLEPGASLWSTWSPLVDLEQTEIAARLMLSARTQPGAGFRGVFEWFRLFDQCLARNDIAHRDRILIERARGIAAELGGKRKHPIYLLHGDLHHGNILSSGSGWKMIDPKGMAGELGFDVGAFIRNPCYRIVEAPDLGTLLQRRLEIFSDILGVELCRLARWSFCACVLSACWSIEDNEPTDGAAISCAVALASKVA